MKLFRAYAVVLAITPALCATLGCQGVSTAGTGTPPPQTRQLSVSSATINVGNVTVGTSARQTASLMATGDTVTITSATSDGAEFTVSGLSYPITLAAGQSIQFTVTFSPQASGLASVTASFASNASNSPTVASLTGTGVAAPVHSVDLSWKPSTSPDVTGYNIYRAVYTGKCGAFAKVNPGLTGSNTYTDPAVVDGTSYCYAATTVNSSNEESGYSNIVSNVQIPPP